jgi:hypothetical protein
MMRTGVLETCRELEYIYKKKAVRQVGYLQESRVASLNIP